MKNYEVRLSLWQFIGVLLLTGFTASITSEIMDWLFT